MSRSSYNDEYGDEFPGQLELFRANVMRSIRSKKGQARLSELHDALVAMPVPALYDDTFISPSGEACALGVWALQRGKPVERNDMNDEEIADMLPEWPRLVVMDIIYQNDDVADGRWTTVQVEGPRQFEWQTNPPYAYLEMTPELRHWLVRRWVEEHLVAKASA